MTFRFPLIFLLGAAVAFGAPPPVRIPILLDTDIGTDIDDAFALALIMKCPEFDLLGVTTVAGDSQARARIAAKMLWIGGGKWRDVPVYAGTPGPAQPLEQGQWAQYFSSRSLVLQNAVPFLRATIKRHPGEITIVALGELTNIAALLKSDPSIAGDIKQIALMGGSVARGYKPGSPPDPEWNIKSNIPAAQAVFSSGIPLIVAPLDVTAMLKLDEDGRQRVFTRGGPMGEALMNLYKLWGRERPTLYDPMAVAMLIDPTLCKSERRTLEVDAAGITIASSKRPTNAFVGLQTDPSAFFAFYMSRVAP